MVETASVIGFVILSSPFVAASLSKEPPQVTVSPFLVGERLVYDIHWAGFKVGQGIFKSAPGSDLSGRSVLYVSSTATSNELISYFFPVKDRIESIMDATGLYSYGITIDQRHGLWQRHKEVLFDQNKHTAVMIYKGKTSRFDVPPKVQDALSSLYYFRAIPHLENGRSVYINVHEGKKNWRLEVQILGRETFRTVLGMIPTVKVKAIVLFEGILWDKGDFYVWLTDDARRIPVMMRGKIMIGAVTATLTQVESPKPLLIP